jgi:hypothetical protein
MDDVPCNRRRALLVLGAACAAAAGIAPAAEAPGARTPQPKKYSKERVGYRDEPYAGRTCAKCVLYAGHGECAIVEGEVSPQGWCLQWTPATMGDSGTHLPRGA